MDKLIIFDLDNTLIASDNYELDIIRRSMVRNCNISRLQNFISGHGRMAQIPAELVAAMKKKFFLAVFSKAPQAYVNFMLQLHYPDVSWDAVVCYEDVNGRFKPDPYGIRMAMMKTRITANSNVLFIGDDCRDRRTAINAGINYFHWNGFRDQISYNQCISQLSVLCYS